jgi:two-component system, OmpR family, sensor histidine kinase VicK
MNNQIGPRPLRLALTKWFFRGILKVKKYYMVVLFIIFLVVAIAEFSYIILLLKKQKDIESVEIRRMEERRSSFISIISHQLRTPLSIIKGYLEALSTGDLGTLSDGQKEYVNGALDINRDTIDLVNDYLKAVRLDTEMVQVAPVPIDLALVIREEIKRLDNLARASNCQLSFQEPGALPKVKADAIKIKQVVENILTNAIKYSSGRGQAVVTLTRKDQAVQFSCQDNGLGIPRDQQAELFTKFFRAQNILKKDTKGSGLGLYLNKKIIEALGGTIWVESEEGRGTTVYFTLPIFIK